jgi:uncharacterized protein (TIGR02231 family)
MRLTFFSASSLAALIVAASGALAPALSGEINADSKIDAVTVYPDAAIVTRIAEVDVPPGDNSLTFHNLPLALDPASLRIEAEGSAAMTIGAVDTSVAPADVKAPLAALEIKLTSLREEREGWQTTIDALQAKRAMIVRYAQAGPEKLSPDSKPLDIGQWNSAWDTVGIALAKLGDELRAALDKAKSLDEEIKTLEAQRQRPEEGQGARRVAVVAISAGAQSKATVRLSYRIAGVGWRPAYDASLATLTEPKSVTLARRALIAQHTGEDWSDVALTVSTSRVARASDVADVQPLHIDFWQPPIVIDEAARAAGSLGKPQAKAAPAPAETLNAAAAQNAREPTMKAAEATTTLESGAYSAEFKTPGRISLASDGAQKSFVLDRLTIQPTLLVKTAPGFDQTAYLQAHFVDTEDAPLLTGDVALHRDGAFVGQSRLSFVAPGDSVDLGFGADDKIKVQRAPVNRKENEPTWFNQSKIETREFKTTVKNLHAFPVKVQVIDQLPVSDNTAISVEMSTMTTPPTEKQVGDKRGVMSWTLDLAPGESKDIHFAYKLKWPADHDIMIGGEPVGPATQ